MSLYGTWMVRSPFSRVICFTAKDRHWHLVICALYQLLRAGQRFLCVWTLTYAIRHARGSKHSVCLTHRTCKTCSIGIRTIEKVESTLLTWQSEVGRESAWIISHPLHTNHFTILYSLSGQRLNGLSTPSGFLGNFQLLVELSFSRAHLHPWSLLRCTNEA
jgi:hypothetical protein